MTKKSVGRRQRDAERRASTGMTGKGNKSFDREKSSRCWYELKSVHSRSQKNIDKLAGLISQYRHKVVLMKIAKNGDQPRFDELMASIPPLVEKMGKDFQDLWDSHADKKKLCLSYEELTQAFRIFEAYQAFDIDLFNVFQPIIGELNLIYNKALKELMEAQDATIIDVASNQPIITDVVLEEGDRPAEAQALEAPQEGLGEIAQEEDMDPVKKNFLEREPGAASRPTFEPSDVRIN
uniref:Uncharacterized protein n=1 Tax=Burkholderia phage vB_BgluM-SURPRISE13 TaxID=3159457 RepID=A0AAU7PF66_9VIRU